MYGRLLKQRARQPEPGSRSNSYKIMVVGDGMVGKTSMCKSFVAKAPHLTFQQPTILETHDITISIHKKEYAAVLWDTSGLEEMDRFRMKDYKYTDCIILCFCVNNPTSFLNIESKWIPELQHHCPEVPILLVGTKNDIRTSSNRWISAEEGKHLRLKIKAVGYSECSAKSIASIEGVLLQAITTAERYREITRSTESSIRCRKCSIL